MNLEDKLKKDLELKEKYFNSLTNTILDKIKEEKDDFILIPRLFEIIDNSKKIERNKLEDPNEIKVLVVELEVEGTAFDFKNMDENGFKGIYKDEFLENFKLYRIKKIEKRGKRFFYDTEFDETKINKSSKFKIYNIIKAWKNYNKY